MLVEMTIISHKYGRNIASVSLVFFLLYTVTTHTVVHQYSVVSASAYNTSSETSTGVNVAGDMHVAATKNGTVVHYKNGNIPPSCSDVPCDSCGRGTPNCNCKSCHPCKADLVFNDGIPEHTIWNCLCSDGRDYPPHNCP